MSVLKLLLEFFGGLVLLLALGCLIGHLLGFDEYLKDSYSSNPENHLTQNEDIS
jgi:hypothetical protein